MANRLLIESSVFKLSKSGIDVLSASDIDLIFSSDRVKRMVQTIISGELQLSSSGIGSATWPNPNGFSPFVIHRSGPNSTYYRMNYRDSTWKNLSPTSVIFNGSADHYVRYWIFLMSLS